MTKLSRNLLIGTLIVITALGLFLFIYQDTDSLAPKPLPRSVSKAVEFARQVEAVPTSELSPEQKIEAKELSDAAKPEAEQEFKTAKDALTPNPDDSKEHAEFKAGLKDCLDNVDANNLTQATAEAAKQCIAQNSDKKKAIEDKSEQKKAEKEEKDSKTALGAILVLAGLAMIAAGSPEGAVVLAIGLAMIGDAQGNGSGDGPGSRTNQGSGAGVTSTDNQGAASSSTTPQQLLDKGYSAIGRSNGDYVFAVKNGKEWVLAKSNGEEIHHAEFGSMNWSEIPSAQKQIGSLEACEISYSPAVSSNRASIQFKRSDSTDKCPDITFIFNEEWKVHSRSVIDNDGT